LFAFAEDKPNSPRSRSGSKWIVSDRYHFGTFIDFREKSRLSRITVKPVGEPDALIGHVRFVAGADVMAGVSNSITKRNFQLAIQANEAQLSAIRFAA
jgi:hypothetical protein